MTVDLAASLRCPHLPAEAHGLGAVLCPSCGWVENGLRQTNEQVLAKHPELASLVAANQPPQATKDRQPVNGWQRAVLGLEVTSALLKIIVAVCVAGLVFFFAYLMLYVFFLGAHPLA